MGKNGLAILSETSDGDGTLASQADDLHARKVAAHVPPAQGLGSVVPALRSARSSTSTCRASPSKVCATKTSRGLSAYMFSDRGIYRPGDEIRVGLIVKRATGKQSLAGVPLEVTVEDARAMIVKHEKLRLSESGFEEIKHITQEASPTGTWNINVYVVKDGHRGAPRHDVGAGAGSSCRTA